MKNNTDINEKILREANASNKGIIRLISASTNIDYDIIKMLLDNNVGSRHLRLFLNEIDSFVKHYLDNNAIIKKYKKRNK